jgi:hypothetical protein
VSDVVLDDGEQVTVLCNNLNVQGHDLLLDSPARRKPNGPQFRRALVHDQNDGLTVNFGGDYPGGVSVNEVAELRPLRQPGLLPSLVPTLVVRGGISYEAQGVMLDGSDTTITVLLDEVLSKLNAQIADLGARVAALEAPK